METDARLRWAALSNARSLGREHSEQAQALTDPADVMLACGLNPDEDANRKGEIWDAYVRARATH